MQKLTDILFNNISEEVSMFLYNSSLLDYSEDEGDEEENLNLIHALTQKIVSQIPLNNELLELEQKLLILFQYERNYLTLLKDFKEEIKFTHELQQDLRKERAKFFSETLHLVSESLKQAQVEETVASSWIQELVRSYTNSLDLSNNLIDENTLNTIGKIRANAKTDVTNISLNSEK